jgi:hypothetical protein
MTDHMTLPTVPSAVCAQTGTLGFKCVYKHWTDTSLITPAPDDRASL